MRWGVECLEVKVVILSASGCIDYNTEVYYSSKADRISLTLNEVD